MMKHNRFLFLIPALFIFSACASDPGKEQVKKDTGTALQPADSLKKDSAIVVTPPLAKPAVYPRMFHDGAKDLYGFEDSTGKKIIPAQFDYAGEFSEGLAPVIKGERHGFIDSTGKWQITLKGYRLLKSCWDPSGECFVYGFSNGLARAEDRSGRQGYIGHDGREAIAFLYDAAEAFSEGYAVVVRDSILSFIDSTGYVKNWPLFDDAAGFRNGMCAVTKNHKSGFINRNGKLVVPCIYESATMFSEGLTFVTFDPSYTNFFCIDTTGKKVIAGPFGRIAFFKDGKAITTYKNKCVEIDTKGKILRRLPDSDCPEGC